MKYNFSHIKLKDKNNNNLKDDKILKLFKSSVGDNIIIKNYNKSKKEYSYQNLEIIYYKEYIKKNIGKMKYINIENNNEIKIFDKEFISNNIKKTKIIINNRKYELKENFKTKENLLKVKIQFSGIITKLNSMFEDCKYLLSVYNLQRLNTKYIFFQEEDNIYLIFKV